ncbi:queuine trna-ribosyltransferase domain-containing protein [Cystoisospora suis]|uniref:Queuine trna-ribosyltransferase domain-containing protein n=1 Tax=Cystoisospora suis TaxID=483139 RepID=A0A2C6KML8_9APIC|nr:queuine trna-ribosyltransferase domain-containing protein [Cystoisospora suis]
MGSDIIMQLDDVVSSTTPDPVRVEEAMYRSLRWLDRCIAAHNRPEDQALFGIVQGGLDARTRTISLQEIRKRPLPGFAIGGLSGGEAKEDFWKMVELSTRPGGIGLPENKPRYLMGVGYPVDILVCVALGCDMFDCVYPCRTARFGTALVRLPGGVMRIKQNRFKEDLRSLDPSCGCYTCRSYSRAFLHAAFGKATAAAQLLTIHNLFFMQTFCTDMQRAIEEGKFSAFAREFIQVIYPPPSRQKKIDKEASLSSSFFVSPDMKKSVLVQREDTGSTGGEAVVQRGVRERGEEDEEVGKEEEDDQKNGLTKRGEEGEDTTGRGGEEEGDSQEGDTMQHSDRENEKEKNTSVDGDQKTVEEDSMSSRGKKKKKRTGKREEGKEENMKTGARNVDQDVACSTSEKSTSSPPLWVYEALKAAGIDISDLYDHFSTEETKTTAMPSNERP